MNEKIKIELSIEQFKALSHCMLAYEFGGDDDTDKVLMARHLLSKVLKKMINRFESLKKTNKISLSIAEAAAFRTLMTKQIDHCGIYEQTIIRDILFKIGSKI